MSPREPRVDEQTAADAIAAVEKLATRPRYEPAGANGPDWRVQLADGRTADVEITTRPDGDMHGFFAALHEKDGSIKRWRDDRLSWDWTIMVVDYDPCGCP